VCSGGHGAADVRAHPFFETIDWASLMTKTLPPPFVPQASSDPLNFDKRYMERTAVDRFEEQSCFVPHFVLILSAATSSQRSFPRRRLHRLLSKILHTCNAAALSRSFLLAAWSHVPFMSPSAFPNAMERESISSTTRSETPVGDDLPTPREHDEKKDKDGALSGRGDSEDVFAMDS
jgi:hypothetical protein